MAFTHKPNSGALFRNKKHEKDTHAEYTGEALIEGVEMWLSAWVNETKSGEKYFSIKFKPKDAGAYRPQPTYKPKPQPSPNAKATAKAEAGAKEVDPEEDENCPF